MEKTLIRAATCDDIDLLMDMATAMHAESPRYSRMAFAPAKVLALFLRLIEWADGLLLVADRDGVIIGGVAGFVAPQWFSDELTATEFGVFMLPEHRGGMTAARLVRAYVHWAKAKGVAHPQLGISTGVRPDETVELYKAIGLKLVSYGFEA